MFSQIKVLDGLGRIVLPKSMRDYYGIGDGDEVKLIATEEGILIIKNENLEKESGASEQLIENEH